MAAKKEKSRSMPLRRLGSSDLQVSQIGIGAMMFGLKTDEAQSHRLLDVAFDEYGVNFIDTSESYPKPMEFESQHKADEIIAKWLKGRDRSSVVLATSVCGRSDYIDWIRKDNALTALTPEQIVESVDASLQRLGTDYIDLLQLEWPDRYVGWLGNDHYLYDNEVDSVEFESQLMALQGLIDAGKVRNIGVCQETPYGVMKFCEHAEWDELPKIASVQNSYNLLQRSRTELGLIEVCSPKNCDVSIIANTALAGGALSGKYLEQVLADMDFELRLNKFPGFQTRFIMPTPEAATKAYLAVAEKHGVSLTQLALKWVYSRPHVACTIVGATSEAQLRENLEALSLKMTDEMQEDIDKVLMKYREATIGPTVA